MTGQIIPVGEKTPLVHACQTMIAGISRPGVFIPHFALINRPTPIVGNNK